MKTSFWNNLMKEFGFDCSAEFLNSSFGFCSSKPMLVVGFSTATIATFVENYIGLDPLVYIAFILLLFLEFLTGIKASVKEGVKIQSKRFGRVILKLLIYTILIGVVNTFRTRLEVPSFLGNAINIYSWIYFITINLIILQLILSVFENLNRLGFEESNRIYKGISKAIKKFFRLVDNEHLDKKD